MRRSHPKEHPRNDPEAGGNSNVPEHLAGGMRMISENDQDRRATTPHARHYQNEQKPFIEKSDYIKAHAVWISRRAQLVCKTLMPDRPTTQRGEHRLCLLRQNYCFSGFSEVFGPFARPAVFANGVKTSFVNLLSAGESLTFRRVGTLHNDEKSFTINLAMASKRILAYCGEATAAPPPAYACHWANARIGSLMPDRRDKWWTLSDGSSYAPIASEVTKAVAKLAIPLLKPHLTEQGLLELWASKTPGGFELPNLKYKSILLALQNRFDELPQAFQRMREISAGNLADTGTQEHIARLKERFSLPE